MADRHTVAEGGEEDAPPRQREQPSLMAGPLRNTAADRQQNKRAREGEGGGKKGRETVSASRAARSLATGRLKNAKRPTQRARRSRPRSARHRAHDSERRRKRSGQETHANGASIRERARPGRRERQRAAQRRRLRAMEISGPPPISKEKRSKCARRPDFPAAG